MKCASVLTAAVLIGIGCAGKDSARSPLAASLPGLAPSAIAKPFESPLWFSDVTARSGIRYRHYTGAFVGPQGGNSRYMPEAMGPGVVLFDYDGDGDLDIFVTNSSDFPGRGSDTVPPTAHLYRNDGDMRFTDVTAAAGLAMTYYGMGAIAADYDGDGHVDLLVTTWGGVRLYRNLGNGRFEDVTERVGLGTHYWTDARGHRGPDWATGVVLFDADGDGDLDLLVINYVRWSPETDIYTSFDTVHKGYTSPKSYPGDTPRLYRREHGRFVDITERSGVVYRDAKALGVSLWDFDEDGRLDVVVANDTERNLLYHNSGGGKFSERAIGEGIAYDQRGEARSGMGIDIADWRNDGSVGVAIGNFTGEPVALFQRVGAGPFRDIAESAGVAAPTFPVLTFGLVFADMDLDGWQDMVMVNGHLEPDIQKAYPDVSYRQRPLLLGNNQNGAFEDWSERVGPAFNEPMAGRGLAVGDLDGDGDLDVVMTANGGGLRILRNDSTTHNHYLRAHLCGRAPNTDAIGARLELQSAGLRQRRLIRTGSSYLSQSELTQTFGLGNSTQVEQLKITWPDGAVRVMHTPCIDCTIVIDEVQAEPLVAHQSIGARCAFVLVQRR